MPRKRTDLIVTLMADMRVRQLPLATKGVLLHLLELLLASPTPGVVRFLQPVAMSVARLVSVAEPMTETEAGTHLEALAALSILVLDQDAREIRLQVMAQSTAKAEAARTNGKAGGAPRKGETREAYLARKQGSLMMPMPGGAAAASGTQGNPSSAPSCAREIGKPKNNSSSFSLSSPREALPAPSHEAVALAGELATMFALRFQQAEVVQGWLLKGWSAATIRTVAVAFAARADRPPMTSIRYLERQVAEQAEIDAANVPAAPETAAYIAAMQDWQRNGCVGPAPTRQRAAA